MLQQIEGFGDPSVTVNDAFKPVTRFWDRIVRPEQVAHSLPHAVATMLDPATCGPAFLALPQDVQGEAYDFPERLFETTIHEIARPRPDAGQLARAGQALAEAERPLLIAGGGVHYSFAEGALATFAEQHNIPVVETVAGKASLLATHPLNAGPIGVTGCTSANALAAEADRRARRRHATAGLHDRLVDGCSATSTCGSSGSTPPGTTPSSTSRFPSSPTPPRASPSCRPGCVAGADRTAGPSERPRSRRSTTATSTRSPVPTSRRTSGPPTPR